MTDEEKKPSDGKLDKPDAGRKDKTAFRIRAFIDLRGLRAKYLRTCGDDLASDSLDIDLQDETEEDFGLKRSTIDEALRFLQENLECENEDDDMTEFLHDE